MRSSDCYGRTMELRTTKALLAVACILAVALGAAAHAQPALDLFDEATYFLALQYGGFADPPPQACAPEIRQVLVARCEEHVDCPVELGVEAIEELIAGLDDPHTSYLPPQSFAGALRLLGAGDQPSVGFGLQVVPLETRPGLVVLRALSGSPGAAAGLRRGDILVALDDAPLGSGQQATERLRQTETGGESTRLTIERAPGQRFEVELEPRRVVVEPTLRVLEGGVGHLDIPSFFAAQEVGPSVHDLVRDARAAGVDALVIDLRDNPGGLLPESLVAAGAFTDEPRRTVRSRHDTTDWVFSEGRLRVETPRGQVFAQYEVAEPTRFEGALGVLVNRGTASAAEFLAHHLQEAGALVVGEPTFGVADTGTGFIGLSNGGGLQITTGKILHPNGEPYTARVDPDVRVEQDLEAPTWGEDAALGEVVERLLRGGTADMR